MNKKTLTIIFITLAIIIILGVYKLTMTESTETNSTMAETNLTRVLLETNHGNIVIELRADMPVTSGNFKSLVEQGVYDNTIFHRIINGFMIQGGDPTGTGYGDSKIPNIKDEFKGEQKNNRGTIAMANAGPNTGSSQFFINLADNNFLDGKHPVFGEVVEGMDVVDKIAKVETDSGDKPLEDVKILKASFI